MKIEKKKGKIHLKSERFEKMGKNSNCKRERERPSVDLVGGVVVLVILLTEMNTGKRGSIGIVNVGFGVKLEVAAEGA